MVDLLLSVPFQIQFWCLLAVVVESFAMGADTVLASACNSGCMAIN